MTLEVNYSLETPEQIEMDYELAGPGSRMCAWLIDVLLIYLAIFILVVVAMVMGLSLEPLLEGDWESRVGRWTIATVVVLAFLIMFGYRVFFEMVMRGQTPGKRSLKLRTIRDDGTPISLSDSLIRNLLRFVDVLPMAYAVGGLVCLFHKSHKRLGDIAAGTIVVKEGELDYRARTDGKQVLPSEPAHAANAELTPADLRTIRSFLERRSQLLPEARTALAEKLARVFHQRYGGVFDSAESYLHRLFKGNHHQAGTQRWEWEVNFDDLTRGRRDEH